MVLFMHGSSLQIVLQQWGGLAPKTLQVFILREEENSSPGGVVWNNCPHFLTSVWFYYAST